MSKNITKLTEDSKEDLRKHLKLLSEMATTSGSVATVEQSFHETQKRETPKPISDIKEYGNWQNSVLSDKKTKKKVNVKENINRIYVGPDPRDYSPNEPTREVPMYQGDDDYEFSSTEEYFRPRTSPKKSTTITKYIDEEGTIEGKDYNRIYYIKADDEKKANYAVKNFEDQHWGAKEIIEIEKREVDGKYEIKLYILDRHKYGFEKATKNESLSEEDLIIHPSSIMKGVSGFVPKSHDRTDHEVEMAKSDLHQAHKNAKKIYMLIKNVSEEEGLEGWVQEKIIKANDYLNAVREYLEGKIADTMPNDVRDLTEFLESRLDEGAVRNFLEKNIQDLIGLADSVKSFFTNPAKKDGPMGQVDGPIGQVERRIARLSALSNAAEQKVKDQFKTFFAKFPMKQPELFKFIDYWTKFSSRSDPYTVAELKANILSIGQSNFILPNQKIFAEYITLMDNLAAREKYLIIQNIKVNIKDYTDMFKTFVVPAYVRYAKMIELINQQLTKKQQLALAQERENTRNALAAGITPGARDRNKPTHMSNYIDSIGSSTVVIEGVIAGGGVGEAKNYRMQKEFLYKKLRPGRYGGVDVVGYREAPESSVLAGQVLKHFIDNYETEEEALEAHPDAEGYSNQYTDPTVSLSHLPGEDDPVPGGMYPDDIREGATKAKAKLNEKFKSKQQAKLMYAAAEDPKVAKKTGVSQKVAKEFIKKSHGQKVKKLPTKVSKS